MRSILLAILAVFIALPQFAHAQTISLAELLRATPRSATAEVTNFHGSSALRLFAKARNAPGYLPGGPQLILNNVRFRNGTIDVDVAGKPGAGADESARGFIGVSFRVQSDSRFEIIYLRPTNSHAADQVRRNHTTQYSSEPDFPFDRMRKESPEKYESWADIETGEWTHMRVVVHGTDASLYVNHSPNPCLVVHDLKLGDSEGAVGLWMGEDTEGYFRNLRLSRK